MIMYFHQISFTRAMFGAVVELRGMNKPTLLMPMLPRHTSFFADVIDTISSKMPGSHRRKREEADVEDERRRLE